jgi:hypothetical protein
MELTKKMNFIIPHIYREGNQCADGIANLGLHIQNFYWWNNIPSNICNAFAINKCGLPKYRFC